MERHELKVGNIIRPRIQDGVEDLIISNQDNVVKLLRLKRTSDQQVVDLEVLKHPIDELIRSGIFVRKATKAELILYMPKEEAGVRAP